MRVIFNYRFKNKKQGAKKILIKNLGKPDEEHKNTQ